MLSQSGSQEHNEGSEIGDCSLCGTESSAGYLDAKDTATLGEKKVTYSNINGIRSKPTISKLCFFLVQQLRDCYQHLPIFLSYYKIDSDRFCSIFR